MKKILLTICICALTLAVLAIPVCTANEITVIF